DAIPARTPPPVAPPPTGQTAGEIPARREMVDLIIGLDFGTAATKVVIRSPYLPGQRAAAVSFGELGHSNSSYLLPTRLRIGSDRHLSIRGDVAGEWVTDLKLPLLERPVSSDDTSDTDDGIRGAVGYLALT